MRNWLRRVQAAIFYSRYFPPVLLPDDYWTISDAKALSNFMTSDTGVKLNHILRRRVNDAANRAVMEETDKAKYLCGVAAGTRGTIAEIDSMLQIRPDWDMSDEELRDLGVK